MLVCVCFDVGLESFDVRLDLGVADGTAEGTDAFLAIFSPQIRNEALLDFHLRRLGKDDTKRARFGMRVCRKGQARSEAAPPGKGGAKAS